VGAEDAGEADMSGREENSMEAIGGVRDERTM
jgi:hypothetical protein